MAQNKEAILAQILNLCEYDPDAGLEFIERTVAGNPEAGSDPFGRFAKAMAYGSKGLFQLARSKPQVDFTGFDKEGLRDELGVTDTHLDYLEEGLQEIKAMEEIRPGALKLFGTEEDKMGELKVDTMAMVLERCRPGRVQAILRRTKLRYFGPRRVLYLSDLNRDSAEWRLSREDFGVFTDVFFSHPSIVRSAIVMGQGTDSEGRKYLDCMLCERTREDPAPGDTVAEMLLFKAHKYLFDDGSSGYDLPQACKEEKREEKTEKFNREEQKTGSPASKRCVKCHASIPADALYCTQCGARQ